MQNFSDLAEIKWQACRTIRRNTHCLNNPRILVNGRTMGGGPGKGGNIFETSASLFGHPYSGRISSVQSLSRVQLFATPWTAACQASMSITNSRSLLKFRYCKSTIFNVFGKVIHIVCLIHHEHWINNLFMSCPSLSIFWWQSISSNFIIQLPYLH